MCVTSMIGDGWGQKFPPHPSYPTYPSDGPTPKQSTFPSMFEQSVTRTEWEDIWTELTQLKELLVKAKQYDDAHNEPNCEMEEKVALIKKFGEIFSIDFRGIFDKEADLPAPNDNEFFRVISPSEGELARFDNQELASKFADYMTKYRNEDGIFVIEVHPVDLSVLKYAVYIDNKLIGAFVEFIEAEQYALTVADAAEIFNPDQPKPEVRITLT